MAFFSYEHYPLDSCKLTWASLYDEPELVTRITQTWREDGLPPGTPLFITESNLAAGTSESYFDIFGAVWLGDYVGAFLNAGGNGLYYFDYLPVPAEHGCNDSPGTFGMFSLDSNYQFRQPLSQFFAAQLINLEWVQPGSEIHTMFPAKADLDDGAGHSLVTAYALQRPDGQWSLLVVNRDQENEHKVRIRFRDSVANKNSNFIGEVAVTSFGREQYKWNPSRTIFMAHAEHDFDSQVQMIDGGHAEPDGPTVSRRIDAREDTTFTVPAASLTVLRGKIE